MEVILRHRVDRDYTVLTNEVLRDARLSWGARGLLAYLLHLPGNFRLSVSYLQKQSPDGRDATRSRIKELQTLGYVAIHRERNATGCYTQTIWTVTDTPSQSPQSENPTLDNPTSVNPPSDNPPLISTTHHKELNETTTTNHDRAQRGGVVVGSQCELLDFPPVFFGDRRNSALQIIASCPESCRQQVLYEVAGIIDRGALRGSPIGLLQGLAKKAQHGMFVPSHAIAYAEKRRLEREARDKADAETALRKQSDPARNREAARKALATIREQIGGEVG